MQTYRISEFTSSTPDAVPALCEAIRDIVTKTGVEIIDVIMMDGGKGVVIARYGSAAAMETAMQYNKEAFGALIAASVVDGSSIVTRSGDKIEVPLDL